MHALSDLAGTLTGRTCPVRGCITSLVKNKQGQLFCVSCDKFCVAESDLKQGRVPSSVSSQYASPNRSAVSARTPLSYIFGAMLVWE